MSAIIKQRSPHSARLERFLGADKIKQLQDSTRGWYGQPIHLLDCPGNVRVMGNGDFMGPFDRGYFLSAVDILMDRFKRAAKFSPNTLHAGFPSISEALSRASQGFRQQVSGGPINKVGTTGVVGATSSLWRVGPQPAGGDAGSAAPGGRACDDTTAGAMNTENPASGTLHLTGADMMASVISNSLMLYDRIFDVDKTMNSTATEAVTGVPTRYQSTTPANADFAGGNFLFVEVFTALAATAHNWTVCTYLDQAGNASTLPSLTGNSAAIINRLDHPVNQFFAPLEAGDYGVKALTQMQCSALVATGAINFVIGHAIGIMNFPLASSLFPFDWLTNKDQTPRIFDDACLALLELCKPATTATTYTGSIYATSAAA